MAQEKNERLAQDLKEKRQCFCSLGTNKVKRRLNKLSSTNEIARAVDKQVQEAPEKLRASFL